jgi:UDP-N-acetylmuramyl pentapeptide phosphotransferase/UDP-N-acetylglucosamine-1-phosphate transferase
LTSLPFFLAALKEDIFRNVHYLKRFFAILISASLFIYFYHYDWPRISFPGFEYINHHPVLLNLFYILVIAGITNGANIIDGMNGLSALKFFSAVSCILILAIKSQDQIFILISILMLGIVAVFLFFNFPYAQIFLGDSGAYFLGFISITNFIVFYGRHAEFSNWGIAVALFYYIFEVLFSILRKLIAKKSPMKPDSYHLHLLTFKLLVKHYNLGELKSNPATTLVLSGYFILPPLFFMIFPPEKIYMGVSFFFLFVVYLLQYFYTHLRVKKLSK